MSGFELLHCAVTGTLGGMVTHLLLINHEIRKDNDELRVKNYLLACPDDASLAGPDLEI